MQHRKHFSPVLKHWLTQRTEKKNLKKKTKQRSNEENRAFENRLNKIITCTKCLTNEELERNHRPQGIG